MRRLNLLDLGPELKTVSELFPEDEAELLVIWRPSFQNKIHFSGTNTAKDLD